MFLFLLVAGVFAADRLSKLWAVNFLRENGPTRINSLLTIRETYNSGLAFGLFQGLGPLVGWLSIAVLAGLTFYLMQLPRRAFVMKIGLALIVGGALGNMVDRITTGQVLDFIETPLRPGVFNVADIMINVGMLLVVAGALLHSGEPESMRHEDSLMS